MSDLTQNNKKNIQDITLTKFLNSDLESFIEIHFQHLFDDNQFSEIYLTQRFKYLFESQETIAISAKIKNDKMVGLVYGGQEGYKSKMNKQIMRGIKWDLIKKPYLLFSGEFMYKYKSSLNRVISKFKFTKTNKSTTHENNTINPPGPILRLTGIAVLDEYSRLGIGKQLLNEFEIKAAEKKYNSIILETPSTNIKAIDFYNKCGWIKFETKNKNLGKTYFYKVIQETLKGS